MRLRKRGQIYLFGLPTASGRLRAFATGNNRPEAIIGFRVLAPLVAALQDPASAPTLAVHMNSRSSLEIEGVDLDSETSIALLSDMEILLL